MQAVSFTVSQDTPQIDGRFWVTETQTFDDGSTQVFTYLAAPGADVNAIAIARTAAINAALAAAAIAVPLSITAVQARRAVQAAGLRAQVEAAVAASDAATQALWYTSETIERDNPQLVALAPNVPLTSDQLDQLFRTGATL